MINAREFRRVCHTAAIGTGGRVLEFLLADGHMKNYHLGLIAYGERTVAVACTVDTDPPVLAVASPPSPEDMSLEFVEMPELVAALAEFTGFRVLTPADLAGPLEAAAYPHLSPHDIRYWRPGDLGDALFNHWD